MNEKTLITAYKLKEDIQNDERYITLLSLEKDMENDDEVCRLSYLKDIANDKYNEMLRLFSDDSPEVKKARKELSEAKKNLESHPKVIAYLKAYSEIRKLFDEINTILFEDFKTNLCNINEK